MKKEYDFSKGVRGKFFRPNARFNVPVYLDGKVQQFVQRIAERKRTDVSAVVNRLLRSAIRLALPLLVALPVWSQAAELGKVVLASTGQVNWVFTGDGKAIDGEKPAAFSQQGKRAMVVQLADPGGDNYVISGELLFAAVGASVSPAVGTVIPTSKQTPTRIKATDKGLLIGKQSVDVAKLSETWVGFTMSLFHGKATFRFGLSGMREMPLTVDQGQRAFSLTLTQGARVRALAARTLPACSPLLSPAVLGSTCNVRLTAPESAEKLGVALAPDSLPAGLTEIDGVPFFFAFTGDNDALDVSKSRRSSWLRSGKDVKSGPYTGTTFKVANGQFAAIHVIAFSTARTGTVARMAVRAGNDGVADMWVRQVADVPDIRADRKNKTDPQIVSAIPVRLADGGEGFLWHLRIPIPQSGDLREYPELAIEFTRDISPDPDRRHVQRVDPPSGAFVLAAAMERSPVAMSYPSAEPGNIHHQGQPAIFPLDLTNRTDRPVSGKVLAACAGPGTGAEANALRRQWTVEKAFTIEPGQSLRVPLEVTPSALGWYACRLSLQVDGIEMQSRQTTFAVLAKDTRQAMGDSPFGVWCFWNSHTSTRDEGRSEKLGSIMNKAGWRWTYGGAPGGKGAGATNDMKTAMYDRFKISWTMNPLPFSKSTRPTGVVYDPVQFQEKVVPVLKQAKTQHGRDNHYIVLHESRSSKSIVVRFNEYLGGQPYVMPPEEKAKFEAQYTQVTNYCAALRKADPEARIVLINDYPAYGQAYMEKGFPAELFDVFGSEGAMFARLPEIQPEWLCLLGQLEQWRVIQKALGYNKPVWFTEALYHPTGPNDMTDHEQGVVCVREAILALEGGVQRLAATGVLGDSSDDYRKSAWGRAGLCYRDPEYNPKPSYAMYAWLTQVLDQARPDGMLDTGSTVLHVLRFRKASGQRIYPLWVVSGRQLVTLEVAKGGTPTVYDVYGNPIPAQVADGKLTLEVSETPLYVAGSEIVRVANRQPLNAPPPTGKPVMTFTDPEAVQIVKEPSDLLATISSTPEIQGTYRLSGEQVESIKALRIALQPDADSRRLLPRYAELKLVNPVTLPGDRPWALEMAVHGDGSWTHIMLEVTDAASNVWTSTLGGSMGEPYVCFDGWQNMQFLLPGNYPAPLEKMRWPANTDWHGGTQGVTKVTYPLKLTKVIVAMRPEILYADMRKTIAPVIHLERMVALPPPDGM